MLILKEYVCAEETIKGSRFLSELIPCESQNQARDIIKSQKIKYADSTHVVHAFIVGNNAEIMGLSDDGEPSGTAGRPILDVLKGHNCTNLILTVTRWFGGTLLGTGGLVKAYSNGAKLALQKAEEENLFEEYIEKSDFSFEIDYAIHKIVKLTLSNYNIYNFQENFGTQIQLKGQIASVQYKDFAEKLTELSNGKIKL